MRRRASRKQLRRVIGALTRVPVSEPVRVLVPCSPSGIECWVGHRRLDIDLPAGTAQLRPPKAGCNSLDRVFLDCGELEAVLSRVGGVGLAVGCASGTDRHVRAARQVVAALAARGVTQVRWVVLAIRGGSDLSSHEVAAAADLVGTIVDPDAKIIFNASIDEQMTGVRVACLYPLVSRGRRALLE